jgi:uncharacterized membrane protein
MTTVHAHLLLNHFPIIGVIIATVVIALGLLLKNESIKKTGLGVTVFSALIAIPTFLSGEGAEDTVEKIKGISEIFIENHEEMAEIYIWIVLILGAVSAIVFTLNHFNYYTKRWPYAIVILISLISIAASVQVGVSGGEIRHSEIREGKLVE